MDSALLEAFPQYGLVVLFIVFTFRVFGEQKRKDDDVKEMLARKDVIMQAVVEKFDQTVKDFYGKSREDHTECMDRIDDLARKSFEAIDSNTKALAALTSRLDALTNAKHNSVTPPNSA